VNWLLLPDDERALVTYVAETIGGALLDGEMTSDGAPVLLDDPMRTVGTDLRRVTRMRAAGSCSGYATSGRSRRSGLHLRRLTPRRRYSGS
jgi:hypothetical protein